MGGGSLNHFKFGIFVGRFQSDGAASMAVKGLKMHFLVEFMYIALTRMPGDIVTVGDFRSLLLCPLLSCINFTCDVSEH